MANQRCFTSLTITALTNKTNDQSPISTIKHIEPGSTKKLLINCSLNVGTTPEMCHLNSLILNHTDEKDKNTIEVASISTFSGRAKVHRGDGVGKGVISGRGESYLHVEWDYPNSEMAGRYKCVAIGISGEGKRTTCWTSRLISSPKLTLEFINQQIRKNLIQNMQLVESNVKLNETVINSMLIVNQEIAQLMHNIKSVETIATKSTHFFNKLKEENDLSLKTLFYESEVSMEDGRRRRYYLRKQAAIVFPQLAHETCAKYGGYLAEIDERYNNTVSQFLNQFLDRNNGRRYEKILISGSDEQVEDSFHYARNNVKMAFKTGNKDEKHFKNCLYLVHEGNTWRIDNDGCVKESFDKKYSYLCEIELD